MVLLYADKTASNLSRGRTDWAGLFRKRKIFLDVFGDIF